MDTTLAVLAFIFSLIGIAGCIVPALPGVILSYAGFVCAYFCSYSQISTAALWIWLAVTVFVSVADYFLPAYMTRRFGGSRAGAIGATIGTVVGFFFIPPLGIGELCHNREDIPKAILVGFGSFLSFIVGTGLKLIAAVGMFLHIAADTYPVARDWFVSLF